MVRNYPHTLGKSNGIEKCSKPDDIKTMLWHVAKHLLLWTIIDNSMHSYGYVVLNIRDYGMASFVTLVAQLIV